MVLASSRTRQIWCLKWFLHLCQLPHRNSHASKALTSEQCWNLSRQCSRSGRKSKLTSCRWMTAPMFKLALISSSRCGKPSNRTMLRSSTLRMYFFQPQRSSSSKLRDKWVRSASRLRTCHKSILLSSRMPSINTLYRMLLRLISRSKDCEDIDHRLFSVVLFKVFQTNLKPYWPWILPSLWSIRSKNPTRWQGQICWTCI